MDLLYSRRWAMTSGNPMALGKWWAHVAECATCDRSRKGGEFIWRRPYFSLLARSSFSCASSRADSSSCGSCCSGVRSGSYLSSTKRGK